MNFKLIEKRMKQVLTNEYLDLATFYADKYLKCYNNSSHKNIIVFMEGKTNSLAEIFAKIFENISDEESIKIKKNLKTKYPNEEYIKLLDEVNFNNFNLISSKNFITTSSLIDLTDIIANSFLDIYFNLNSNITLPKIHLIDTHIFTGERINNIINELEYTLKIKLKNLFQEKIPNWEYNWELYKAATLDDLSKILKIHSYAKQGNNLCLRPSYTSNIQNTKILNNEQWNFLLLKMSSAISCTSIGNMISTWQTIIKQDELPDIYESQTNIGPFLKVDTEINKLHSKTFLWNYKINNKSKALATIRFKYDYTTKEDNNGNVTITPFIIFANSDINDYQIFHEELIKDFNNTTVNDFFKNYYINSKTNNFVMDHKSLISITNIFFSGLILIKFLKDSKISYSNIENMLENNIEYEFLSKSHCNIIQDIDKEETKRNFKNLIKWQLEHFNNIDYVIDKYLKILLNKSNNLFEDNIINWNNNIPKINSDEHQYHKDIIKKITSNEGAKYERSSYIKYNENSRNDSKLPIIYNNDLHAYITMIKNEFDSQNKSNNKFKFSLPTLLAYLIHSMDFGYVTFNSKKKYDNEIFYYLIKSSKEATLQYPLQYNSYIPVISLILSGWAIDKAALEIKMRNFIKKIKTKHTEEYTTFLEEDLLKMIDLLYYSKQNIEDWNFPLFDGVTFINGAEDENYTNEVLKKKRKIINWYIDKN